MEDEEAVDSAENGKRALIEGIEKDAKGEADKIKKDAEKQAEDRKRYLKKQVDSILKEAREKARVQSDAIKKKVLSGLEIEIKRRAMRVQDKIFSEIMDSVKEKFGMLVGKSEYRAILSDWIVEAMIGLGTEKADVNASKIEKHLIDEKLLTGAEKMVKELTGRAVKLGVYGDPVLSSQGVVLTAGDGRTAFNNQVATRLLRKQRSVRKLMYERLADE